MLVQQMKEAFELSALALRFCFVRQILQTWVLAKGNLDKFLFEGEFGEQVGSIGSVYSFDNKLFLSDGGVDIVEEFFVFLGL